MKNILIIYPHWPPGNLAGVHRPRLISNFISEFGWQPIILTVKHEYYEEPNDFDMLKTVNETVKVHSVKAFRANKKFRFIGDIGLRAFFHLLRGALEIIKKNKIDFIWIPIPSFYTSLLGRIVYEIKKIPYGVDYIDPWVHQFPGSNKFLSRHWFSTKLAVFLEPIAVKKASLISGVSEEYYKPVLQRNFSGKPVQNIGMPYGFDPNDHKLTINNLTLPWNETANIRPVVYAGAFLPKSELFIKSLFESLRDLSSCQNLSNLNFFFLGTGTYFHKSISDYAAEYGVENLVYENRSRIPYLNILNILAKSYGAAVIGSTEKHYTASKIFQSLLSHVPVFAILHEESSAVKILKECNAANYLVTYYEGMTGSELKEKISSTLGNFISGDGYNPDYSVLEKYSAKSSAQKLANRLNEVILKS